MSLHGELAPREARARLAQHLGVEAVARRRRLDDLAEGGGVDLRHAAAPDGVLAAAQGLGLERLGPPLRRREGELVELGAEGRQGVGVVGRVAALERGLEVALVGEVGVAPDRRGEPRVGRQPEAPVPLDRRGQRRPADDEGEAPREGVERHEARAGHVEVLEERGEVRDAPGSVVAEQDRQVATGAERRQRRVGQDHELAHRGLRPVPAPGRGHRVPLLVGGHAAAEVAEGERARGGAPPLEGARQAPRRRQGRADLRGRGGRGLARLGVGQAGDVDEGRARDARVDDGEVGVELEAEHEGVLRRLGGEAEARRDLVGEHADGRVDRRGSGSSPAAAPRGRAPRRGGTTSVRRGTATATRHPPSTSGDVEAVVEVAGSPAGRW